MFAYFIYIFHIIIQQKNVLIFISTKKHAHHNHRKLKLNHCKDIQLLKLFFFTTAKISCFKVNSS
jgi:hypothetical protein